MPEIGGFLELALPDFGDPFPSSFLRFQSARSALRAVLERDVKDARKLLPDSNVYIPTYWEDARQRIEDGSVEKAVLYNSLVLPCDQRYTAEHTDRLTDFMDIAMEMNVPTISFTQSISWISM